MDTKKLIDNVRKLETKWEDLEQQKRNVRKEIKEIQKTLSDYWGFETYGLKIGDKIQWKEKTWRGKVNTITMIITEFSCRLYGDNEDKTPIITGTVILRNGQVGVKQESWYSEQQSGKFTKL
jgi:hypothetical protein